MELYVLYGIHGGCRDLEERRIREPLEKNPFLQHEIARFKSNVRKISISCVHEEEEWKLQTSYRRTNRLKHLGISNKHASIRGTPAISEDDNGSIAKAILMMRGASTKKHKEAHEKGELKLVVKPFTYKGTSYNWLKVATKRDESWCEQPAQADPEEERTQKLSTIGCPLCTKEHAADNLKLKIRIGFCNLACQRCRGVTSTSRWVCPCGSP